MVQPQWLHEMHGCVVEAEITCMLRGTHRWKQFIRVGAARSVSLSKPWRVLDDATGSSLASSCKAEPGSHYGRR